uniref:Uncharacterized protein n=1 Tax=Arundo donax TaxID=35708 RepID=A0A0A9FBV7_ARUDO
MQTMSFIFPPPCAYIYLYKSHLCSFRNHKSLSCLILVRCCWGMWYVRASIVSYKYNNTEMLIWCQSFRYF